ncbi:MAG TPA: Flp pilus assembly protein CpaB [Gaiellaceae bacterium]|nr:Flp pilus assembly protein CpaB [Gaiellaceae bacterium]
MTYQVKNIVIAVALGLLAVICTTVYVTNYRKHVQHGQQSVSVLVARNDIPAGTSGASIISGQLLKTESVPRTALVPGAISSPAQIARLATVDEIMAGEQVTTRRFGNASELGIRAQLTGNLRAIQVAADPNQILAGTLKAGDHVDLVGNMKVDENNSGNSVHFDRVVLRNLLVLRAPTLATTGTLNSSTQKYSVTLAVTDAQAPKLYFVIKNADPNGSPDGGWALALRPVTNSVDSPDSVADIGTVLLDGLSAAQRARLVTGPSGVQ